jgi:hypothetical protein
MRLTWFWVGAGVVAVVLAGCGIQIFGFVLFWAAQAIGDSDRERWDKSPRFMDGELVTPILSPDANAARKHAFADPDLDRDPIYLPAYIYRRPDHNPKTRSNSIARMYAHREDSRCCHCNPAKTAATLKVILRTQRVLMI